MRDELLLQIRAESFYDWSNQLDSIKNKLEKNSHTAFLISAPFGFGKSSFTNILNNELKTEKPKDWLISVVEIWRYELLDHDTIVQRLIYDLIAVFFKETALNKIDKNKRNNLNMFLKEYQFINKNVVKGYGKELVNSVLKEFAKLSLEDLKKIHRAPFSKKLEELGELVKNDYLDAIGLYSQLIQEVEKELIGNKKIIFIFRDCDRVNPENLLKVVDCIFHINISQRIKFIVEADEKTIKSILSYKYNLGDYHQMIKTANRPNFKSHLETINGYLDKIFDVIINVERSSLNEEKVSEYLSKEFSLNFSKSKITFANFTLNFDSNFRFIKRKISLELKPIIKNELSNEEEGEIILNAIIVLYLYNELNSQKFRRVLLPSCKFNPHRPNIGFQYIFDNKTQKQLFNVGSPPASTFNLSAEDLRSYINSLSLVAKEGSTGVSLFNFAPYEVEGALVEIQNKLNEIILVVNKLWSKICGNPL